MGTFMQENAGVIGQALQVQAKRKPTSVGVSAPDRDRLLIASIATGKNAALEEIDLDVHDHNLLLMMVDLLNQILYQYVHHVLLIQYHEQV